MNRISLPSRTADLKSVHEFCAEREVLCGNPFCHALPWGAGPCHRRLRVLNRGERLAAGEDRGLTFWIVLTGAVAMCAELNDGRRQIVDVELPGDVVCGMSSVPGTDGWIEVLEGARVCELDLSEASDRLYDDLGFNREMFRHTHERLRRAANHKVALGRLDGMERMCWFLADIARRSGRENGGGTRVHLPMSRADIADYLGLNAETVSRLLGRIRKQGLALFLSPTEYMVPDVEALEATAPEPWRRDQGARC